MLIGVDVNETKEFILPADAGDDPTVFLIGRLDVNVAAAIKDAMTNYAVNQKAGPDGLATMTINKNAMDVTVVRLGLKGWRNLKIRKDGQLVDLPFETETIGFKGIAPRPVVHNRCMAYFAESWIEPLAKAITGENFLTPDESKN